MTLALALFVYFIASVPLLRLVQLKEYFFPSILAHFDYPSSWRLFLQRGQLGLGVLWLFDLLLAFFGYQLTFASVIWYPVLLLAIVILFLERLPLLRQLRWTPKFIFINFLLIAFLARLIGYGAASIVIVIFLATRLGQFPLVLLATWLANAATNLYARRLFQRAHQKIVTAKGEGLRIIGVTGSYGKSGTKELLAQLLGTKFKVLRSPLRLNAELGLSQFVLAADLRGLDFLVLELGTRGVGELELLVRIFEPEIVFLTGLAPQHVGVVGSFAKIVREKFSVFRSVVPGGIALLNGADPLIVKLNDRINVSRKYLYGGHGPFRAEVVRCSLASPEPGRREGSEFTFIHPHGQTTFKTNLIAPHQIENLVGALAGCWLLGLKPEVLQRELQHLTMLPHSYELRRPADPLIIDDSYNANIVGVARGAEYFCSLPLKRKVIIFAGILELGTEAPTYYRDLVEAFRGADDLLLTATDFVEVFQEALGAKCRLIKNQSDLEIFWSKLPRPGAGLLILGRVPSWAWTIIES